jgi:hypothetical protein
MADGELDLATAHADIGERTVVELVKRANGLAPETLGGPVAGETGASPHREAEPARNSAGGAANGRADGQVARAAHGALNFEGRRLPRRIGDLEHGSISCFACRHASPRLARGEISTRDRDSRLDGHFRSDVSFFGDFLEMS